MSNSEGVALWKAGEVKLSFDDAAMPLDSAGRKFNNIAAAFYIIYNPTYNITKIGATQRVVERLKTYKKYWRDAKLVYLRAWPTANRSIETPNSRVAPYSKFEVLLKYHLRLQKNQTQEFFDFHYTDKKRDFVETPSNKRRRGESIKDIVQHFEDIVMDSEPSARVRVSKRLYEEEANRLEEMDISDDANAELARQLKHKGTLSEEILNIVEEASRSAHISGRETRDLMQSVDRQIDNINRHVRGRMQTRSMPRGEPLGVQTRSSKRRRT